MNHFRTAVSSIVLVTLLFLGAYLGRLTLLAIGPDHAEQHGPKQAIRDQLALGSGSAASFGLSTIWAAPLLRRRQTVVPPSCAMT